MTARFFNYFQRRKFERKEFEAEDHKTDDFINYIFKDHRLAKYLVQKKFVIITHLPNARYLRKKSCAASSTNEYLRMFAVKDPSQREIPVGNAFRSGFNDTLIRKKMTRWTELMPNIELIDPGDSYTMERLDENVLMTKERRHQQLLYCLDEKLEAHQKETTFAGGFHFFMAFWILLTSLLAFAHCVLLTENLYYDYWKEVYVRPSPRANLVKKTKKVPSDQVGS